MHKLFVLVEKYTNGFLDNILDISAVLAVIASILVIVSKNPIVSVLFLIVLFLSLACYLMMLGMNFIGLSYLLVYVGAISILFLFILMLINVRVSELLSYTSNSIPLAVIVGITFNQTMYPILSQDKNLFETMDTVYASVEKNVNSIRDLMDKSLADVDTVYVSSTLWDGNLTENTHIASIGNIMYTSYSIWLIITSIILLLAMVGTIVITVRQN